jgi:hypothetical protein
VDDEGRGLDARLLRVGDVVDLDLVAVLLRPAGVHAHEHLGPVRGVHTAGGGADVHHGLAVVVLAGEHGGDLQRVDRLLELTEFGVRQFLRLGGVLPLGFLRHLVHHRQVVEPGAQPAHLLQPALHVAESAGDLLGVVRVVPQGRVGGLRLELADLCVQFVQVEHLLDGGEGAVDVVDRCGHVRLHGPRVYSPHCCGPSARAAQ